MNNDNRKRIGVKMQDLKTMCDTVADYTTRQVSDDWILRQLLGMQEELNKALRFATGTSEYDKLALWASLAYWGMLGMLGLWFMWGLLQMLWMLEMLDLGGLLGLFGAGFGVCGAGDCGIRALSALALTWLRIHVRTDLRDRVPHVGVKYRSYEIGI